MASCQTSVAMPQAAVATAYTRIDALSARVRPMRSASQPKRDSAHRRGRKRQRQQHAAHSIVDAELAPHVVEDERVQQHVHRIEHPAERCREKGSFARLACQASSEGRAAECGAIEGGWCEAATRTSARLERRGGRASAIARAPGVSPCRHSVSRVNRDARSRRSRSHDGPGRSRAPAGRRPRVHRARRRAACAERAIHPARRPRSTNASAATRQAGPTAGLEERRSGKPHEAQRRDCSLTASATALREIEVARRLIVKRAVRLDVGDRHALRPRRGDERRRPVRDHCADDVVRQRKRAAAAGPADRYSRDARQRRRRALAARISPRHRVPVAGVPAARDVHRGEMREQSSSA